MLFSKPLSDLDHADLEQFCRRFNENIRVEYKGAFDGSVKAKLPAIVSSFGNSHGGILVIGVNARNGIAEDPISGIDIGDREPRLTIENICRDGIYPELIPRVQMVVSREVPKKFVVVSVEESQRAPHAIENSKRVYVRTGDSNSPYDLADLDLLARLLRRRESVKERWAEFVSESREIAMSTDCFSEAPTLDVCIGPQYPVEIILTREQGYDLLSRCRLQPQYALSSGDIFRHNSGAYIVRHLDGRSFFISSGEYAMLFYRLVLEAIDVHTGRRGANLQGGIQIAYPFWWIARPLFDLVSIFSDMLRMVNAQFGVKMEGRLSSVAHKNFILQSENTNFGFFPVSTNVPEARAMALCDSTELASNPLGVCSELAYQLRWPFGTDTPHSKDEIVRIFENFVRNR